ncbi:MAG: zinc-dependent alcohol dehydrogenase family protein [Pyrinomonadaceae bacterium]
MKAYEIQRFGIDELALVERDVPQPGKGEVLVRLHAASLNYRDLMVVKGQYNPRMKLPAVPFSDGAGEVVAVGEDVGRWAAGDRVMPIFVQQWYEGAIDVQRSRTALGAGAQWDGVLREYAVFDERSLVRVPDHLSYDEAATLPCAAVTAWHALVESGGLKAGETVLTLGSGGVSIFALQIAKLAGARVIATTGDKAKEARLSDLGADVVINYREREDWDAAVLEATGKTGVDHVVEVGGGGTLARSINAVRVGGHIALIGALEREGDFSYVPIFMKLIRMQGIFVGSRAMFENFTRAAAQSGLRPVIDRTFEFDEVRQALRYMESGAHFGKIVVRI